MTTHTRGACRVALVDRFRLVTQALDLALAPFCRPVPVPVQTLHSTAEVLAAILRSRPEVVVLGEALGGSVDREQLVEELTAQGCRVVAIAGNEVAQVRLRRAGAAAALPGSGGIAAVRTAIEKVVELAPVGTVPPTPAAPDPRRLRLGRLGSLTRREVAVLAHLTRGRSAAEIARAHVVSEMTVRSQVKSILRKLDVSHQLGAVALAHAVGWEPPYPDAA